MNIDRLVPIAVALALIASSTGHLPSIIVAIHKAQAALIQDSKASKWGHLPMLQEVP